MLHEPQSLLFGLGHLNAACNCDAFECFVQGHFKTQQHTCRQQSTSANALSAVDDDPLALLKVIVQLADKVCKCFRIHRYATIRNRERTKLQAKLVAEFLFLFQTELMGFVFFKQ